MEYLSNPLFIGACSGSISVLISYIDNRVNVRERKNDDYIKLFFIVLLVSSALSYAYNTYIVDKKNEVNEVKNEVNDIKDTSKKKNKICQ